MRKFLVLVFAFLIFPFLVLASDKVEINTASLQQLDEIIGIGPALAQRIIDTRPFFCVDDLIKVKGIGEKTLQKIKEQGLVYVEDQVVQPTLQTPPETPPEAPPEALSEPLDLLPQDVIVPIVYPDGIYINELLPSPEGPDETEEWIEIFNQNNFGVDLSGWKIKDGEGSIKTYVFQTDAKIAANGYLVLTRPVTKIILNNTGDKLTLIKPNEEIADEVAFEKALKNQSYSKKDGKWHWTSSLTPGKENDIEATKETKETKETKILDKKQLLSSLNQGVFGSKNFITAALIALAISVFTVIIIILFLFFIKKIKN